MRLLDQVIRKTYLPSVISLCPVLATEKPGRLGALVSWTFNLGPGNLRASTLRRKINAGEWGEVPAQIMRWNKAGGVVLRGLTRRRQAEANLI